MGDDGQFVNLKTGNNDSKGEDKKDVVVGIDVGKVTYADKDEVKRHDLNAIEKNINKEGNQDKNLNVRGSWNPFKKKATFK